MRRRLQRTNKYSGQRNNGLTGERRGNITTRKRMIMMPSRVAETNAGFADSRHGKAHIAATNSAKSKLGVTIQRRRQIL